MDVRRPQKLVKKRDRRREALRRGDLPRQRRDANIAVPVTRLLARHGERVELVVTAVVGKSDHLDLVTGAPVHRAVDD